MLLKIESRYELRFFISREVAWRVRDSATTSSPKTLEFDLKKFGNFRSGIAL